MKNCNIHIKGMHCRSCEILIEEELLKISGVKEARAQHGRGMAEIYYQNEINESDIEKAVHSAGYSLGIDEKSLLTKNPKVYQELGIAFLIAMVLYLSLKNFGILNVNIGTGNNYSNLLTVLLVGLTAGVSTCMALVGGLVLSASAKFAQKNPNATVLEKFQPHLYFNLGRIVSYTAFGAVIGLFGSFFQLSTTILGFMIIAAGFVMLFLGTQLLNISPFINSLSLSLPKGLGRILGIKEQTNKEYSHSNSAIMGALTFFLPCGFTQAMQLYAMSTGDPVAGALTMGVFALGTAPGLLGVGGLTSLVRGAFARIFFKTVGIVVILLALFNIQNGINLSGFNIGGIEPVLAQILGLPTSSSQTANINQDANVKQINGVQEVRMVQNSRGYTPNTFTIQKGIPVKWIITSEDSNTCAASIVSQKFGIRQGLSLGENIIEFTPEEAGNARFSCIMGMFTGSFTVIDGISAPTDINQVRNQIIPGSAIRNNNNLQPDAPAQGSSCGGGGCGCGGGKKSAGSTAPQVGTVTNEGLVQVVKAIYSVAKDMVPNQFTVKAGRPVRFEIEAQEDGSGCMGSIALPGLSNKVEVFTKGKTTIFEFTPTTAGTYKITCAMGVPRGEIIVTQ